MMQKRANRCKHKTGKLPGLLGCDGAGERNRTVDLRITNALLYQLSYTGKAGDYRGLHGAEQRTN